MRMRDIKNAHKILDTNPKGRRPHKSPIYRRKDNIKIYTVEVRLGMIDWINLAPDRDQ